MQLWDDAMGDLFDKSSIWAFDDLTPEEQAEAREQGFEPGCRYMTDDPQDQVAECPFCHRSTIYFDEWFEICPHIVFIYSGYNGYDYVRPGFTESFWANADTSRMHLDQEEIDILRESGQLPPIDEVEAQLPVATQGFDVGIDNVMIYGFTQVRD